MDNALDPLRKFFPREKDATATSMTDMTRKRAGVILTQHRNMQRRNNPTFPFPTLFTCVEAGKKKQEAKREERGSCNVR
jgi:hypothetical protein